MKKILVSLAVMSILTACGAPNGNSATEISSSQAQISSSAIAQVRSSVRKNLKDPGSARFGAYRARNFVDDRSSGVAVCGKVNAKNSLGGYAGETLFLATKKEGENWLVIGPSGSAMFSCMGYGFQLTVGGDFLE